VIAEGRVSVGSVDTEAQAFNGLKAGGKFYAVRLRLSGIYQSALPDHNFAYLDVFPGNVIPGDVEQQPVIEEFRFQSTFIAGDGGRLHCRGYAGQGDIWTARLITSGNARVEQLILAQFEFGSDHIIEHVLGRLTRQVHWQSEDAGNDLREGLLVATKAETGAKSKSVGELERCIRERRTFLIGARQCCGKQIRQARKSLPIHLLHEVVLILMTMLVSIKSAELPQKAAILLRGETKFLGKLVEVEFQILTSNFGVRKSEQGGEVY